MTDVATCDDALRTIAQKRFGCVSSDALEPPLLYGRWLSKQYAPTSLSKLRRFVASRLRTFHEECLDVPLVVFDDVARHALRIDSVLYPVSISKTGDTYFNLSASNMDQHFVPPPTLRKRPL